MTNRFDVVADELQADRLRAPPGEEVDDTAADAELARLIDGILAGVAGCREQVAKVRAVRSLVRRRS